MIKKVDLIRKRKLLLRVIVNSSKILIRFSKSLVHDKKIVINNFEPDSQYCIEGTINQLRWNVKNAIFITLSNSSQLFFDSGELLFQVKNGEEKLKLTAYGVGKKEVIFSKIKVITLNTTDFSKIEKPKKEFKLHGHKIEINREIYTYLFNIISQPKSFQQIKIDTNNSDFQKTILSKIKITNSTKELNTLKKFLLESDHSNTNINTTYEKRILHKS